MQSIDLTPVLPRMAAEIRALETDNPLMIGIHTGGAWIAQELHRTLAIPSPLGSLDISFYRDDFSRVGLNPKVQASDLPESVEDRQIILVDDVLQSGRTIRAALNEIFSWGRPSVVRLVVALDRGGRELPIQAEVVGIHQSLGSNQHARITRNQDGMEFQIVTQSENTPVHDTHS